MNGHFTCNRREKRLLTELSSTGGKKQQFETVLITNYLMSSIKKTACYSKFETRYIFLLFYSNSDKTVSSFLALLRLGFP